MKKWSAKNCRVKSKASTDAVPIPKMRRVCVVRVT